MSTTTFTRFATALSVIVVVPVFAATTSGAASAHEPREQFPGAQHTAYSEPQTALGGHCLAQYVADHQAGRLGPIGV